jgi:hypothetical protein
MEGGVMSRSRPFLHQSGAGGWRCRRLEEMPMEPIAVVALATAAGMPLHALDLI